MTRILNFIGLAMVGIYAIGSILYWNDVYPGGIGLFGSIMTLPISMILAFIISTFSSLGSAITNVLWFAAIIWLIGRGNK